ncbi:MAG: GtrA family protein [Acidimicrobiia bacterium]|nr:GtrA family protein [Acidimicrobiia bacterium]
MTDYIRSLFSAEARSQIVKVGAIGVVNTIVDFSLANIAKFAADWSDFWSVTLGFTVATAVSYMLNRRWTFAIKHGRGLVRETVVFYAINVVAWAVTVGIVEVADAWVGPLNGLTFNLAKISAVVVVLLPKFAGYRDLVFRRSIDHQKEQVAAPTDD